jgi:hypothetical protein
VAALISSFQQIRLSGQFVTTSGGRLKVGSENTLMVADSGAFANLQYVSSVSGVLAQQISANAAGVSTLNGLSGAVTVNSASPGVSLVQSGTNSIFLSGVASAVSVTNTGVALGAKIDALSGYANNRFVYSGNELVYTTGVVTGSDMVYINHLNYAFPTIPKVNFTIELTESNIFYSTAVSGRSTTGFWALFSDVVAEQGILLNVIAKV